MTKNEYIASIMLEAAELLKNDNIESLNEGYTKNVYNSIESDLKALKKNMIKANTMRMQSKFDESIELLNKTIETTKNLKPKLRNTPKPGIFARMIAAIFGESYIKRKTGLRFRETQSLPTDIAQLNNVSNNAGGNSATKRTVNTGDYTYKSIDPTADTSFNSRYLIIVNKFLDAAIEDMKKMIQLCENQNPKKLSNLFTANDRGLYNYRLLNKSSKKEIKNSKAIQEAIDLLYDKAILCEDAGEAAEYVQKAEELQKAIEDIPEEIPVKQDEYETSVVGGDDEKPDLDEIKDLCDNDPEVIKLLTDDEDKSVTVDDEGCSNCNESVYDFFNLDF